MSEKELKEELKYVVLDYEDGVSSFYYLYSALEDEIKNYLAKNFKIDCAEDFEIFMSGYYFNI